MINGKTNGAEINGANGAKTNGAKSIFFERMPDGSWTVSTQTADGEIAVNGKTIPEARAAFDELLKARA